LLRLEIESIIIALGAERAIGLYGFTIALALFVKKSCSEIIRDLITDN
jgi:hypothetical protein